MKTDLQKTQKILVPVIFVVLAIVCILMTPLVKINYNISDYLDDSTETKISLDIMEDEFGLTGTVQVMIRDITVSEAEAVKAKLSAVENVLIVNFDSQNESYYKDGNALFAVMTNGDDYSETSREVAAKIQSMLDEQYGDKVEYDGTVVEKLLLQKAIKGEIVLILTISLCLVALLMLITAESWIEPLILLLSSGFAVIINMGTNLIFGEISYITNAVASILQLALSIDYSIVLLHRYRALRAERIELDNVTAMRMAVKSVTRPVAASALTTMAGLLALLFMSFKIGVDIGSVLMKSILISAITAMTLLPSLLLIFEGLMQKTRKRALHVKGDIFTNFTFKFKKAIIPVAAVFIVLGAVLQSFNTYSFTDPSNKNKNLQQAFGNNNSVVVVYPNGQDSAKKEAQLKQLLEAYRNGDNEAVIKSFTAYSNSIGVEYSAEDAAAMFGNLEKEKAELLFKMYYLSTDSSQVKLPVRDVIEFAGELIENNDPDIEGYVTPEMAGYIDMFLMLGEMLDEEYTAEGFYNEIMTLPIMKDFPLSKLAIQQMYGMYLYGSVPGKDKWVNLSDLLSFLCTRLSDAEEFSNQLSTLLGFDASEQFDAIMTDDLKVLISGIGEILDQNLLPAPNTDTALGEVKKDNFFKLLDCLGVGDSAETIWNIVGAGAKDKIFTDQLLGALPKVVDLLMPDETDPMRNLILFISEDDNPKPSKVDYANYKKLYDALNANYTYENLLPKLEKGLCTMYELMIGGDLKEDLQKDLGVEYDDLEIMAQQLYILYYNGTNKMPETPVTPRDLIDFIIDKLQEDALLATIVPDYASDMLGDLRDLAEKLKDPTAYDYKEVSETVNSFLAKIDGFEIDGGIGEGVFMGLYVKHDSQDKNVISNDPIRAIDLVRFIYNNMEDNVILSGAMSEDAKQQISALCPTLNNVEDMLLGENYSRILISVDLPVEGDESIAFVKYLMDSTKEVFGDDAHVAGEMVSSMEQKEVFNKDNVMISIITLVSVFLIILFVFRSVSLPIILVATIQGAIWICMSMSLVSGPMFFMSYIMATCILMGATIDYGILLATNYLEARKTMDKAEAIRFAVNATMPTIFTSGIILMICGLVVGIVASQMCIASVGFLLFRGTLISVIMITVVLPSLLYAFDTFVLKFTKEKSVK